ncbi:uncharacterized protein LOC130779699 [Actinidia eriantha]|uniref:uncharacterized protein LOC130779699 n=1 Tax=Actinidia eriantha TaxID=165200 RepID=UPI00258C3D1F|nr:uncharacterized protein LOC130779699 [Actinidia eriantha]XP_057494437.1 uncharacterized protein LOC130779699 [Actinidia eriantha]XP_057494438.1 uncharacterized protein LOC130779699 [Actinidia eriantha]XP_057494439.1 uncharacterized protein LOC130779699 [Actinidia eriantha]
MKRKRGNKKGKSKKPNVVVVNEPTQNVISVNTEDNSGSGDVDKDEIESGMEVATLPSTGADQPEKLPSINTDRLIERPAGKFVYGRVKVRIKTSKALDSQITSSDAPTQSDTDKSSQQGGPEKNGVVSEKMEDSANSLHDPNPSVLGNQSKKAGSIKIKSSRGFGSSTINPCGNAAPVQCEQTHQKELGLLRRDPRYNEQELRASLEVVKKIMKMDAAEPFNAPVNPIALGIPDYFEVIDTPMDFGTICNNLETGVQYMNSEDVFKDVQYIWENCYKYNNKGDYVVELMKRVKKNFMKYWTAAGLHTEQAQGISGVESTQSKDVAPNRNVKTQVKVGHLKHKSQKRHGVKKHKDDCLCAICVMMHRRQEREESAQIEDQTGPINSHQCQEMKPEDPSPAESPSDEDTSSNMDNSPGPDVNADLEEKREEVKLEDTAQPYSPIQEKQEEEKGSEMEIQTKGGVEISGQSQPSERSGKENSREYPAGTGESGDMQVGAQIEETSMQHDDKTAAIEQLKAKELAEKKPKAKMYENLHCFENPMLLKLCGTLFPDNRKSVWSGAHSLVRHRDLGQNSSIHEAIMAFMK